MVKYKNMEHATQKKIKMVDCQNKNIPGLDKSKLCNYAP